MSVYKEKKSKLGKKGEIYTDKEIRKLVGIDLEDEIFIIAKPGIILVKKIPTLEQLLLEEPLISINIKEFETLSEEFQKKTSHKISQNNE